MFVPAKFTVTSRILQGSLLWLGTECVCVAVCVWLCVCVCVCVCVCALVHTVRCDGSHKGSAFKPIPVEVRPGDPAIEASGEKTLWMCGCKQSKTPPYCDGTHNGL